MLHYIKHSSYLLKNIFYLYLQEITKTYIFMWINFLRDAIVITISFVIVLSSNILKLFLYSDLSNIISYVSLL